MPPAPKVGEGGDKYCKVPEQQGSVRDLPQSPYETHWSWHYPPTCIPPSRPLKTYGFEIPFPLNPYFPKDLSHHPCTGAYCPAFLVKRSHTGTPKHHPAQRVTVQTKGTHIPAVRPTAGSQSRQLYLSIYPHVFIYKMLNIRRLNYSYWSEMVCKNFISNIYLHTH